MEPNEQNDASVLDASEKKVTGSRIDFPNTGKSKPTKVLPSDRITMEKQLEMLRAFVVASESENGGPVTNEQVGRVLQMSPLTILVMNAFFKELGLLSLVAPGKFSPSQAAKDYEMAYKWKPETAGLKLASAVDGQWFAQALCPILKMKPLRRTDALAILAEASKSSPDYQDRLKMLVELLAIVGIVSFDGDQLTAGRDRPIADDAGDKRSEHGRGGGGDGSGINVHHDDNTQEDSRFTFLDRQQTKKVTVSAKDFVLTAKEKKRLIDWINVTFFLDEGEPEEGENLP